MTNYSLAYLDALRRREMEMVANRCGERFHGARILEIGSGDGTQLKMLRTWGREAVGVELADSEYRSARQVQVRDYDGSHLPFGDASFDVVFSSNVMEHVENETELHAEMRRVLAPGGAAIHVVPSAAWRHWTSLTHYAAGVRRLWRGRGGAAAAGAAGPRLGRRFLFSERHGTRGTFATEWWHFRAGAWRRRFTRLGWRVVRLEPLGLAYSGYGILAGRLSLARRERLAPWLGSACHLVVTVDRSEAAKT